MKVNQIRVGAILSYIVIFLNVGVGLLYTPVLIRCLGQSEYGLYSLIANVISYLTILDLGFGNAIIVYTAKYRARGQEEEQHKLNGMFLIIYTIIGIIAAIAGVILYFNVERMFGATMSLEEIGRAKTMMLILILNLVVTFPFTVFSSVITAYERFVFAKLLNIARIIIIPCIMLPLLFNGYKSVAMVMVTTGVSFACLISNAIYCFKAIKIKFKFGKLDTALLKEIFAYSFFVFLNIVIDKVNWSLDQFILGAFCGTVEVAIYSVAVQFGQLYLNFSTAISGILLPKISEMVAKNKSDKELSDVFIKTGRLQYIVIALILSGFLVFGRRFIIFWAGVEYIKSFYVACLLMVPLSVPMIQTVGISILQAKNKHKFRTLVYLAIAVLNIIITLILTPKFGGVGAAIGTAISTVLGQGIIMNIYYYKKAKLDMPRFWREILKMSIPVILLAVLGVIMTKYWVATKFVVLVIQIAIYSVAYAALMWTFSLNSYEKNLVLVPVKKILRIK